MTSPEETERFTLAEHDYQDFTEGQPLFLSPEQDIAPQSPLDKSILLIPEAASDTVVEDAEDTPLIAESILINSESLSDNFSQVGTVNGVSIEVKIG